MKTIKRILAFILKLLFLFLKVLTAGAMTMLIGSFFSTQRVLGDLGEIGAEVQFGDRISMIVYDIIHFGGLYWGFITLAFLLAFIAVWALRKAVKLGRVIIFILAGSIAMLVMLLAMEQVFFGVPIVAGARDSFGLILQMLAGGIGGFIFAKFTATKKLA